jgi:hypothetical protein
VINGSRDCQLFCTGSHLYSPPFPNGVDLEDLIKVRSHDFHELQLSLAAR